MQSEQQAAPPGRAYWWGAASLSVSPCCSRPAHRSTCAPSRPPRSCTHGPPATGWCLKKMIMVLFWKNIIELNWSRKFYESIKYSMLAVNLSNCFLLSITHISFTNSMHQSLVWFRHGLGEKWLLTKIVGAGSPDAVERTADVLYELDAAALALLYSWHVLD